MIFTVWAGPNPPMPDDRANTETSTTFLGVGVSTDVASIQAPSSTNSSAVNIHNNLIQMNMSPAKYSITQGSIVDIKDWNLLDHNTIHFSPGNHSMKTQNLAAAW